MCVNGGRIHSNKNNIEQKNKEEQREKYELNGFKIFEKNFE